MKSTAIVYAIAAASLGFSALSFAQGNDRRGPGDEAPRILQQEAPHYGGQHDYGRNERHDERRFDHRDDRRYGYPDVRQNDRHFYYNARGPEFRRGGYIPRQYRNHQYYVTDYRMHHLSPPPRGQQWVQVGPDYVLIALATGLIAHMVLSH